MSPANGQAKRTVLQEPAENVDELDRTILNHDQSEIIQQVLEAAYGPADKTGVDIPRPDTVDESHDPNLTDPAEPFAERTMTDHPGLALREDDVPPPVSDDDETEWSEPMRRPTSDEPTRKSATAQSDRTPYRGPATRPDVPEHIEEASSADPWADKTYAHAPEIDEVSEGTAATEPDVGRSDDLGPETADIPFDAEQEESVPAITDEGRLGDAGASGLFGALSVLDDSRELALDDDDDAQAEPTVGRYYAEFSESMGRVKALPAAAQTPGEGDHSGEFSKTRMGILADPIEEEQSLPSFALHEDEATHSVQDDAQGLSISQQVQSELPEPEAYSLVQAQSSNVAGLRLEFDDESGRELSYSTVNDTNAPAVERDRGGRIRSFSTAKSPPKTAPLPTDSRKDTPLAALDSGLQWPTDERSDGPGLISESFELRLESSEVRNPQAPSLKSNGTARPDDGSDRPPVRPVSMVQAPGGVDDTPSRQFYDAHPISRAAAPRGRSAPRGGWTQRANPRAESRPRAAPKGHRTPRRPAAAERRDGGSNAAARSSRQRHGRKRGKAPGHTDRERAARPADTRGAPTRPAVCGAREHRRHRRPWSCIDRGRPG